MYNLTFKNIGIIVILLLFFASCTSGIEIPEDKKEYIGIWTSDTMNLQIHSYGRIDYSYESGAFSSSFTGPIQEFTDEYIKAGVWLFSKTFTIDTPIFTDDNGYMQLEINSELLTKQSGPVYLVIPDIEKLNELASGTTQLFITAILEEDFDILLPSSSLAFQRDFDNESLSTAFTSFFQYKEILEDFIDGSITFSQNPFLDQDDFLQLEGVIYTDTSSSELHFQLGYRYEYPDWKLVELRYRLF